MSSLDLNSEPNISEKSSLVTDSYEGFTEFKQYFEKSRLANAEISIFVNRLIAIFEKLLSQLEFAATLPLFLSRPQVLDTLEKSDLRQVVSAFLPFSYFVPSEPSYTTKSFSGAEEEYFPESVTGSTFSETVCSSLSQTPGKNSSVRTALTILHSYHVIRDMAKKYEPEIPKCTVNFLRQLFFFLDYVVSTAKLTPQNERDEELRVTKLQADLEKHKKLISELTVALEEQKIRHETEAAALTKDIETQMNNWIKINEEFERTVSETLKEAEEESAKSLDEFKKRMEQLEEELKNLKDKVEEEQKASQKVINAVAGKKFKVESQLTSLILKYDTDSVEGKQAFEEIMAEFNELDDQRAKLMEEMEEQRELYDNIVREREEKVLGAFKQKYDRFVRKRSAKIIQRWWRAILKTKKKKKGKAKNKKKAK